MTTKDELAAEVKALKAKLAELETTELTELETELAAAKEAYRANTDDVDARERLSAASAAINTARAARRSVHVVVGGDAVKSEGTEG